MKRSLIIILLSALHFSCEDELNIAPTTSFTTDNFFRNADDIEQVVISSYGFLQSQGQYGENFPFLMEVPADNATETSLTIRGGDFGQFEVFSVATTNQVLNETWTDCYKGIQSCNVVLNRIEDISMDETLKATRKGEVKFLRGLTYFNLVRIWGEVPLVLIETTNPFDFFDVGKSSVAEIYAQIKSDLTDAANALPSTQIDVGRATSGAANTLLGKVHLTLGEYDEAITVLRKVTGYSLVPSFSQVFGPSFENNAESIFEVQFTGGIGGEGSKLTNLFTPTGSIDLIGGIGIPSGHNSPTQELFDSYDVNDDRRDITIGTIDSKYYPNKYITTPKAADDSDINVVVLRYADVVLMLAEALNEKGYAADGEAFGLMNQIRNRAGLGNLSSSDLPDQESFRLALADERRLELAFENHRWFDLVRTGKAEEVMNAKTTYNVQDYHLLFPVPQTQVDTNSDRISQNLGY